MATPELQLRTLYVLDRRGRIASTREPGHQRPAAAFALIRGAEGCAWAVRSDVPDDLADELHRLARREPATPDLRTDPVHAQEYLSLVGGEVHSGPAFAFPDTIADPGEVVLIDEAELLERHFADIAPEIEGRAPILAIVVDGGAVSVCYCARRSDGAAEAGLQTAPAYRGRGYGPRATAAWALALRASGRVPLYSTSWKNEASLAVARKLNLVGYASDWNIND